MDAELVELIQLLQEFFILLIQNILQELRQDFW
jgi:hypothetical protein